MQTKKKRGIERKKDRDNAVDSLSIQLIERSGEGGKLILREREGAQENEGDSNGLLGSVGVALSLSLATR